MANDPVDSVAPGLGIASEVRALHCILCKLDDCSIVHSPALEPALVGLTETRSFMCVSGVSLCVGDLRGGCCFYG